MQTLIILVWFVSFETLIAVVTTSELFINIKHTSHVSLKTGASNAMLSPSDATQFLSNMGYITMLLVAESTSSSQSVGSTAGLACQMSRPTSSTTDASGLRQGLEVPSVGRCITGDELRYVHDLFVR